MFFEKVRRAEYIANTHIGSEIYPQMIDGSIGIVEMIPFVIAFVAVPDLPGRRRCMHLVGDILGSAHRTFMAFQLLEVPFGHDHHT